MKLRRTSSPVARSSVYTSAEFVTRSVASLSDTLLIRNVMFRPFYYYSCPINHCVSWSRYEAIAAIQTSEPFVSGCPLLTPDAISVGRGRFLVATIGSIVNLLFQCTDIRKLFGSGAYDNSYTNRYCGNKQNIARRANLVCMFHQRYDTNYIRELNSNYLSTHYYPRI